MQESNLQLFVYGSLRSGFHHPAYQYISRYFTLLSEGTVKGTLYDMGEYPAAVPDGHTNKYIIGELYRINHPEEFDWAMAQLDDYEGLNTENNERPLYRREMAAVFLVGGGTEQAWVYWFNGDVRGKPIVDSGDVLQYMHQKNKS